MNPKTILVGALTLFAALSAHADFAGDFQKKYPSASGAKIERAFPGFYSVSKNGDTVFVNDAQTILIQGDVIDLKTGKSVTAELKKKNLPKINVSELNTEDAIKIGSGSKKLYVFSDPDCPYCRQLEKQFDGLTDTTIYVFPLPLASLHPNAEKVSEQIWCSKDPAKAWHSYATGQATELKSGTCANPIAKNLAFAQKHGIYGTPALIFSDGTLVPGLMPADQLQSRLNGSK